MVKIATYNINGINGRLTNLLRWLEEAEPDVLCLQELKCTDDAFPDQILLDFGYYAIWHGQQSWNGVAILSKQEIKETRRGLDGDEADIQSRYIEAFTNGMVIGCLYLPNGNPYPGPKFDYKLAWFRRFLLHAKRLLSFDLPVALIGDYNVIPNDMDTYKPEKYRNNALFRRESRELFELLLEQGWSDAIRHLYPNQRVYTFWDYLRDAYGRNAGLRLDHFLLNDQLADRLIEGAVDADVRGWPHSSDHAPAWIKLNY